MPQPTLQHPQLTDLLKKAYSAEKAAAFAYQGHAASVKSPAEKVAIRQIEIDEWNHRKEVLQLMDQYGIQPSTYYECRFHIVGKIISFSFCSRPSWIILLNENTVVASVAKSRFLPPPNNTLPSHYTLRERQGCLACSRRKF